MQYKKAPNQRDGADEQRQLTGLTLFLQLESNYSLSPDDLKRYFTTNTNIPIILAVVVVIKAIITESLNSNFISQKPDIINIQKTSNIYMHKKPNI